MGIRITVRAGDLIAERDLSKEQAQRLHAELWKRLREVSFALERRIKSEMPVDTGRARASWGRWSPAHLRLSKSGNAMKAGPGDSVWNEDDRNLSIEQGSNVEYIGALNDGHSRQAPAGFLDTAEQAAVRELNSEIDRIIARWV